ncbi:hypothetical protein PMI14_00682 [Acidovorax sp. CF316]|uniref:TnsD family Tn7-like transposition protein n=1 Tax=Acidovorax sp. CF316 TaxID=1144317 RepID=UPI00026BBE60|nr:TnsD family Tn7-like transposition protein [Acidovorax sp. CF316]EJE54421.1 hypothetical protein PMI14_00682 [Acidovorax sp. CF316]
MNEHLDLFSAAPLLTRLPDESLFSLVSRHHFLWGNSLASTTSKQFFSHSRCGSLHDFPNRLQILVERTGAVYGDARDVAINLTLLKFYRPFLPPEDVSYAVDCLSHGHILSLRIRLGIATSRFLANHPLKACFGCMQEDLSSTGWAYWHIKHQYPGVWACTKHAMLLQQSRSTSVGRFQWALPRADELRESFAGAVHSATPQLEFLASFATLVETAVSEGARSGLGVDRFNEHYRAEFMNRGWLSVGGHMRLKEISTSFLNHVQLFQAREEFAGFPVTLQQASTQLGRFFSSPRAKTHPFRHLVMIHWLFGTWDRFVQSTSVEKRAALTGDMTQSRKGEVDCARRKEFEVLVRGKSFSPRAAGLSVGIDPQTAQVWAAKSGIAVQRRPKKLHSDLRKLAIRRLRRGAEKSAVATEVGVSIETISRVLWTEVGLQRAWTEARHERARAQARKVWAKLLNTSSAMGMKWMRTIEPAAYAWLYRNDRSWLIENKPSPNPSHRPPQPAAIDWQARDEQLSVAVERACLQLLQERGERLRHVNQLYPLIPQLHAKRGHLDKLPLTRLAIQRSIAARPQGASDLLT